MAKKKCNLKEACSWSGWFLIGAILCLIGGVRYLLQNDDIGTLIYLLAALLFTIGYIGQAKFNKK